MRGQWHGGKGATRRPEDNSKILSRWPYQEPGESKDDFLLRMRELKSSKDVVHGTLQ